MGKKIVYVYEENKSGIREKALNENTDTEFLLK